jgi:PIN domain nuclease of toxin-antitoxin system
VRLLLDTQTFLWFILADPRLSATALGLITDPVNHKHVSPASYWEIAIKIRLGKYTLPVPFEPFMSDQIAKNHFTSCPSR